jgi:hypothetical protein
MGLVRFRDCNDAHEELLRVRLLLSPRRDCTYPSMQDISAAKADLSARGIQVE